MAIRRLEIAGAWAGSIELDLPLRVRRIVQVTMNKLASDYPSLKAIDVKEGDPTIMENILATKSATAVYLNPHYWMDKGKLKKHQEEWHEAVVDSSIAGVLIHEVGHILDGQVLRKLGSKKYNALIGKYLRDFSGIWNDESPSAYGQENVSEFMAEAFSAYYLNKMLFNNDIGRKSFENCKALWTEMNKFLK